MIARILKAHGLPPVTKAPDLVANLFTTEVWTCRGLVTFYTLFAD
jgi:hypothetical protein